jgi:hypothetical protein
VNVLGDIIGVGLLAASAWTLAPYLARWYRHERDLSRRVRQYEAREDSLRQIRGRW